MELIRNGLDFAVKQGDTVILECSKKKPLIYLGIGRENVEMYRGNFKIDDYLVERKPLSVTEILEREGGVRVEMGDDLSMDIRLDGGTVFCTEKPGD